MTTTEEVFIEKELWEVATPGQKVRYRKLLEAKRARKSPLAYLLYDSPRNQAYAHTRYLNEVAMALVGNYLYKSGPGPASIVVDVTDAEPHGRRVHPVTGEPVIKKLMTSMPPRIGKSFFWGKYFTAWFLTLFPDETIMYMSYAASLAERFSRLSRDTVMKHPELGTRVDPDLQNVKEWGTAGHEGGFIARGFGGIPTGRGGNLLIDDPFQDGEDAMSDLQREKVWNQYVSSLITRVERDCWTIVNGTRWHEDDLHGRLIAHEPNEWYVVNIPAIAFDTTNEDGISVDITIDEATGEERGTVDPLGRRAGEAICPQLYPASFYIKRQTEDPFWFDAEYMGKPSGIGGGLFKDFSYYRVHRTEDAEVIYEAFTGGDNSEFVSEKDCVRFLTADTALKDTESSDWTVIGIWDLDPWRRLFLRHVIRERVTGDKQDDFIREAYAVWGVRVAGIEEAAASTKLIQDMVAAGGINIWPLKPDKNKKVRALPAAVLFKKKHVFVDRDAEWRPKYESELKKFDKDKHDDQVDMTSYSAVMRDLLAAQPVPAKATTAATQSGFESRMTRLSDSIPKKPTTGMVISAG